MGLVLIHRLVDPLTSPTLLRLVAFAALLGASLGYVVHSARLDRLTDPNGEPVGGDFISFYTAGALLLESKADDLYDLALQQQTQGRIVGAEVYRALCSFVNPPVVAVAYVPLALLPFRWAGLLHTLLMAAALAAGLYLLRPHLRSLREHWLIVVAASFLFYPLAVTITGGQNTALSFLLMAATYALLRRGHEARAGVALGLLLFKPQLVLSIGFLLLLKRRWRAVLSTGGVGIAYYGIGAAVCGPLWPAEMLAVMKEYWPVEHAFNGARSISLIGFCENVLPPAVAKSLGILAAGAVLVATAWVWCRHESRRDSMPQLWALAVCATVLVSPHTQWYDGGLVLLATLLMLDDRLSRGATIGASARLMLIAGFFLPAAFGLGDVLGWQPVILLPVGVYIWVWRSLKWDEKLASPQAMTAAAKALSVHSA